MRIAILGAGIAGLSTAWFLRDHPELEIELYEAADEAGGLARSFTWQGFDCDLAPHRLHTDDAELLEAMRGLVPMHQLRRRSQINIGGKWIRDPVNAIEVMLKYLPRTSLDIGWHYLYRPQGPEESFEGLVLNQFGQGLNRFFFKPYSEKLFGIPADQISPEWGRRKIRVGGVKDMVRRSSKLYFKSFWYPDSGGYGAICERLYGDLADRTRLSTRMVAIRPGEAGGYRIGFEGPEGAFERDFDAVVSSLPLTGLLGQLGLDLSMRFRPAMITYLLVDRPQVTENHWFYLADGHYTLNRVAEFKNFVHPDRRHELPPNQTVLCCEATQLEDFSVDRVVAELAEVGALRPDEVREAKTIRLEQAYPIYDLDYEHNIGRVRDFLARSPALFLIGRNAQFEHKDVDEIFDDARGLARQVLALAGA